MTLFDIIILCILLITATIGFFYGFLKIVFSMLAWILAFVMAGKLTGYVGPMLASYIDNPILRTILVFSGLFIMGFVVCNLIAYLIIRLLDKTKTTLITDRVLGLFFGVFLGGLIVFTGVFLGGFADWSSKDMWQQSKLIPPFQTASIWSGQYLPEELAKYHIYQASINGH